MPASIEHRTAEAGAARHLAMRSLSLAPRHQNAARIRPRAIAAASGHRSWCRVRGSIAALSAAGVRAAVLALDQASGIGRAVENQGLG